MSHPSSWGRRAVLTGALCAAASSATAQTSQTAPSAPDAGRSFSVAIGVGHFEVRDIARTTTPVDASPVGWRGTGVTFDATRDWNGRSRLKRLNLKGQFADDFEYRTPLDSFARPGGDGAYLVRGSYEYRRYLFSDLFARGFDVGLGAQFLGEYAATTRQMLTDVTATESAFAGGVAVVAAARVTRWSKVGGEVAWSNGGRIARLAERNTAAADEREPHSGGGWLTHLQMSVAVALTPATAITATYFAAGDGLFSSHRNDVRTTNAFLVGVRYAR